MVSSGDILTAIREISNTKQLDRTELHGLLQDGISRPSPSASVPM